MCLRTASRSRVLLIESVIRCNTSTSRVFSLSACSSCASDGGRLIAIVLSLLQPPLSPLRGTLKRFKPCGACLSGQWTDRDVTDTHRPYADDLAAHDFLIVLHGAP